MLRAMSAESFPSEICDSEGFFVATTVVFCCGYRRIIEAIDSMMRKRFADMRH